MSRRAAARKLWLLKSPSSQDGRQPHVILTVELLAAKRIGRAARRFGNGGTSSPAGKPMSLWCRGAQNTAGGTTPQCVRSGDEDADLRDSDDAACRRR